MHACPESKVDTLKDLINKGLLEGLFFALILRHAIDHLNLATDLCCRKKLGTEAVQDLWGSSSCQVLE